MTGYASCPEPAEAVMLVGGKGRVFHLLLVGITGICPANSYGVGWVFCCRSWDTRRAPMSQALGATRALC